MEMEVARPGLLPDCPTGHLHGGALSHAARGSVSTRIAWCTTGSEAGAPPRPLWSRRLGAVVGPSYKCRLEQPPTQAPPCDTITRDVDSQGKQPVPCDKAGEAECRAYGLSARPVQSLCPGWEQAWLGCGKDHVIYC